MTLNLKELVYQIQWLGAQKALQDTGLPSEWDQDVWVGPGSRSCGTVACLAGNVLLHNGFVPEKDTDSKGNVTYVYEATWKRPGESDYDYVSVWQTARDILGLESVYFPDVIGEDEEDSYGNPQSRGYIFSGSRSYDQLMRILASLVVKAAKEPENKKLAKALGLR